jgi:uncharacterized protein (DUF2236 family)
VERERLGADSLLVRIASDWRSLLPGPSAGLLQLLHPAIGAGVADHSAFFSDPFGRIYRSIPQIWATLLAPDGNVRGRHVRDLHQAIKGHDHRGDRYHALEPDVFWWAHATFTWEMFRAVELFHRRQLTKTEKEQLYLDTVAWYARYGVSMRPVPADHEAFVATFDRICREELDLTPAGRRTLELAEAGAVDLPFLPPRFTGLMHRVVGPSGRAMLYGALPPQMRERFAIPYTTGDRRRFQFMAGAARLSFEALPNRLNQPTLTWALRWYGSASRARRFTPPHRAA